MHAGLVHVLLLNLVPAYVYIQVNIWNYLVCDFLLIVCYLQFDHVVYFCCVLRVAGSQDSEKICKRGTKYGLSIITFGIS